MSAYSAREADEQWAQAATALAERRDEPVWVGAAHERAANAEQLLALGRFRLYALAPVGGALLRDTHLFDVKSVSQAHADAPVRLALKRAAPLEFRLADAAAAAAFLARFQAVRSRAFVSIFLFLSFFFIDRPCDSTRLALWHCRCGSPFHCVASRSCAHRQTLVCAAAVSRKSAAVAVVCRVSLSRRQRAARRARAAARAHRAVRRPGARLLVLLRVLRRGSAWRRAVDHRRAVGRQRRARAGARRV